MTIEELYEICLSLGMEQSPDGSFKKGNISVKMSNGHVIAGAEYPKHADHIIVSDIRHLTKEWVHERLSNAFLKQSIENL